MPIIIAVILALSVVGGGVVYAAETAPPSSPLHPIQVVVNDTVDQVPTATATATSTPTATTVATPDSSPTVTLTPTTVRLNSDGPEAHRADDNNGNRDGHLEPITGTLPVTMTFPVTDTDGITVTNPFTGSLGITFTNILTNVEGLGNAGPGHEDNGLLAKLRAAARAIARGQSQVAARILNAFAHELNALNQSGRLSSDSYTALTNDYASLISQLGGTPVPTVVSTAVPSVTATPGDPSIDKHSSKDRKDDGHRRAEQTPWPTGTATVVPTGTASLVATPTTTPTGGSSGDDATPIPSATGSQHGQSGNGNNRDHGPGQAEHPVGATNPSPTNNVSAPVPSNHDSGKKADKSGNNAPANSSTGHSVTSGGGHPAPAAPSNDHSSAHGSNHRDR